MEERSRDIECESEGERRKGRKTDRQREKGARMGRGREGREILGREEPSG
jgi:hypothetical protein